MLESPGYPNKIQTVGNIFFEIYGKRRREMFHCCHASGAAAPLNPLWVT
jgi:hypothetical protein